MIVYSNETLTNNGTISMKAKGAYAKGQNTYLYRQAFGVFTYLPVTGADGASSVSQANSGPYRIDR